MKKIMVKKEEQGGDLVFTFRFKTLSQLLDLEDPAPLPEKELTEEAEAAIAGHLDEYRVGRSACLVIEVPQSDLADGSSSLIPGAIRHHFGFRHNDLDHDLKISLREGLYSFIVSLGNAAFLVWFLLYISKNEISVDSLYVTIFLGFLTILNWVTIWDTYEHFVYDYRNIVRKRKIFHKTTQIPIEVKGY